MTSSHPDDDKQPHGEDQGEERADAIDNSSTDRTAQTPPEPQEHGDVRSQDRSAEDPVDAETKKLSHDEAQQHDSAEDAQRSAAEDGGGYGH